MKVLAHNTLPQDRYQPGCDSHESEASSLADNVIEQASRYAAHAQTPYVSCDLQITNYREKPNPYANQIRPSTFVETWQGRISSHDFLELSAPIVEDFHAFELDDSPNVLMLDFKTSERQSKYLDRISYYVEVNPHEQLEQLDFETTLDSKNTYCEPYSDKLLCGLAYGHDLTSDDIARFFNTMTDNQMGLSEEETALKELLILLNVLQQTDDGYVFAKDHVAIVSTCRSFVYAIRRKTMIHEWQHAYYFTNSEYQTATNEVWNLFDTQEQKTLASILYYTGGHYNIDDPILLRNEVASYSLEEQTDLTGWNNLFDSAKYFYAEAMPHPDLITPDKFNNINHAVLQNLFNKAHKLYAENATQFGIPTFDDH